MVVAIMNVGRWIEIRRAREKTAIDGIKRTDKDFLDWKRQHEDEHRRIWRELERQRERWHNELTPWRQGVAERVATIIARQESLIQRVDQLWEMLHSLNDR